MKWGLICKPSEDSFLIGKKVYEMLGDAILEYKIAEYLGKKGYSIREIGKEADAIVIVGGDGTILMTLQHTTKPIFSINTGRIGFLTEVEAEEAEEAIKKLLNGEYYIEKRLKIKAKINGKELPDASNEIAIHTANVGKILLLKLYVDGELAQTIYGDGLIISTPMGSTSYALSVGGPVVDPSLKVYIIAPIAPFRHIASALVVPADKKLEIEVEKKAKIAIDGIITHDFLPDEKLEIVKSENEASFIKLKDNFYKKIYEKLSFRISDIE